MISVDIVLITEIYVMSELFPYHGLETFHHCAAVSVVFFSH